MPEEEDKQVTVGLAIATGLFGLAVAATAYGFLLAWAAPPAVYTCPYCGAEFATKEELLAHIQAEHPEQPSYICPYCDEAFWTEEELQQHIELEHPELPPELPPPAGDFVYTEQQCGLRPFPGATAWRQPLYSVRITNQAAAEGTRIITLHVRGTEYGDPWPGSWEGSWEQTLGPGQSVVVTARGLWPIGTFSVEFDGIPWVFGPTTVCYMHIEDDAGGSTPECSV